MKKLLTVFTLLLVICSACSNQGNDPNLSGEAKKFYEKAKNGDAEAMNSLGNCYSSGVDGAFLNYEKAVYWYKKAAKKGNAGARCNLGYCFEIGREVKQDYKKAAELYRKAAEQGCAEAQYRLGYCYNSHDYNEKDKKCEENIFGLKPDPTQAIYCLRTAAKNGYAEAQYTLGRVYSGNSYNYKDSYNYLYDYLNESLDSIKAKTWYKKAAKQGHKDAEKELSDPEWRNVPTVDAVD